MKEKKGHGALYRAVAPPLCVVLLASYRPKFTRSSPTTWRFITSPKTCC
jgi:hypothetical protein